MKLACSVCVGNRLLPSLAIKSKTKHARSTIALCKHPKTQEYCILLFTGQDKTGTKYPLKDNISQVLTRFVKDGKATIQFRQPPHDIYIQNSNVIELKSFLQLLKRAVTGKVESNEFTYSSLSVTPIRNKDVPRKKLIIRKRSDYPMMGFPSTLEALSINDVNRCSLDRGILSLTKLKILDLSNNCIEFIPEELARLPCLRELNLASNSLDKATPKQWKWMGGKLSQSLITLNLESNKLLYLPDQLCKLYNLVSLNVCKNRLKQLPTGIGNLRELNELKVSDNQLTCLPGSIKRCQFNHLALDNNNFSNEFANPPVRCPKILPVRTLRELAARKVLEARLPYDCQSLPTTLVDYLDRAKFCVCGAPCFDVYIKDIRPIPKSIISHNISLFSSDFLHYIPVDCYFCSLQCYRNFSNRIRHPVIR